MLIEQLEPRRPLAGGDPLLLANFAAPIASDDSYVVVEDGSLSVGAPGVLVNDTDPDTPSSSLAVQLVNGPAFGTLNNFNSTSGAFEYVPNANFFGTDSFTYQVSDGTRLSNVSTVSISVTPINDAPVVRKKVPDQLVYVGTQFNLALHTNVFADADGEPLSYQVTRSDGSALPEWLQFDSQSASLTGVPLFKDIGVILLRVRATDAGHLSADDVFHLATANVPEPAPKVESVVINDGQSQRSKLTEVKVVFDSTVYLASGAITIERMHGSLSNNLVEGVVSEVHQSQTTLGEKTIVSLTFPPSANPSPLSPDGAGSLKDARYRLRIDDIKVVSLITFQNLDGDGDSQPGGDYLYGTHVADKFFRLYGDIDGDGDVEVSDRDVMVQHQLSPNPITGIGAALDYDNDHDIDAIDLSYFDANLFKTI